MVPSLFTPCIALFISMQHHPRSLFVAAKLSSFVFDAPPTRLALNGKQQGFCCRSRRETFHTHSQPLSTLFSSFDKNSSPETEREELLNRAAQLRQEAQSLESQLEPDRQRRQKQQQKQQEESVDVTYDSVSGSSWALTFRGTMVDEEAKETGEVLQGKVNLTFRPDGYTDLKPQQEGEESKKTTQLVTKIWGWDEEEGEDDVPQTDEDTGNKKNRYLLFSADVTTKSKATTRIYFQARVEVEEKRLSTTETKNVVLLTDGTVSVKTKVVSPSGGGGGGWWGVFGGADRILARFTKIGECTFRPVRV